MLSIMNNAELVGKFCNLTYPEKIQIKDILRNDVKNINSNEVKLIVKKSCKICGTEFTVDNRHRFNVYCSTACQEKGSNHGVSRFEIFQRDHFQCQYCGRSPHGHGVVLVIDHVVPLSKGGKNIQKNLITSCTVCNLQKSTKELNPSLVKFFTNRE